MKKISILGAILFTLFIITSCKTEEQKKQDEISACIAENQGMSDKQARKWCTEMIEYLQMTEEEKYDV